MLEVRIGRVNIYLPEFHLADVFDANNIVLVHNLFAGAVSRFLLNRDGAFGNGTTIHCDNRFRGRMPTGADQPLFRNYISDPE
jgi:hypothetical protein